ncbi:MAG: phage major capsid protein [Firmicutes bacterium]|nr:phage major capsid protein [Bacillota bacterium]
MGDTISMATNFPPELVTEVFDLVRGKSTLAKLSRQTPVPFTGKDEFTFQLDGEASLVGENGAKVNGGATLTPVNVKPYKIEYGVRVSDEFMKASEERRVDILRTFKDGFAKKAARALDMIAFAKVNPKTGATASQVTNDFTTVTNKVLHTPGDTNANINDAAQLIGDYDMTGLALSKTLAAEMATEVNSLGVKIYPELEWGASPENLRGIACDVNATVNKYGTALAIVGDFDCFRWGFAEEISMNVIPYGDPDNSGYDLAGHNQVYLRCEAYIGFAVLDPAAFARIETPYAIKYDGNGADGGTAVADTIGMAGEAVEVASNTFTKTGKTFSGWNTAADGSGTSYAAGASYTLTSAGLKLYAQWAS